jgi:hypothetical protein
MPRVQIVVAYDMVDGSGIATRLETKMPEVPECGGERNLAAIVERAGAAVAVAGSQSSSPQARRAFAAR